MADDNKTEGVKKALDILDRAGALPISVLREHFERMIKDTPQFRDNTPLGIMQINGEFHHYMNADTDTMWIGFALGMRVFHRILNTTGRQPQ